MTDDTHPPEPINVLHVDGYPPFVELTAEFLEGTRPPIRTEPAGTARAALDAVEAGGVDCVLSGYELPDATGLDLLADVRAVDPELPFVVLTAARESAVEREALRRGTTAFLRKEAAPEQFERLATVIATAAASRAPRDAPMPAPASPDAPRRQP